MSESATTEIRSLLIPLAASRLLLPNAAVAEVLDYQALQPQAGTPDWYLGRLAWRGISIPVISFEGLLGGEVAAPGRRGRILVLNTLNGNPELTHIGLVSQAIPSLVRVAAENVESAETSGLAGGPVKQAVHIDGELALIPDLDELEEQLLAVQPVS